MSDLAQSLITANGAPAAEIIKLTREGLSVSVANEWMDRYALSTVELFSILGTSRRTFKRRENLNSVETDRLLRFASLMRLAEALFDNPAGCSVWLHADNRALGGVAPVTLLDTDAGTRQVETVLGRLMHGVYS